MSFPHSYLITFQDNPRMAADWVCALVLIVATIVAFKIISCIHTILTVRYKRKKPSLVKKNWEKDMVYFYQFPRRPFTPNISPFCLKVETFLIHHGIKFEMTESQMLRSTEGKMPFVELNGKQIPDSQLIILELTKHFNIRENLNPKQKAQDRIISRFLDHATSPAVYYNKIGTNTSKFVKALAEEHPLYKFRFVFIPMMYTYMWQCLNGEGTGRHQPEQIQEILHADLEALDDFLGDNEWILGGNEPSLADMTLFSHIAGGYHLPYDLPIQELLEEEFPRLIAHHNRMADRYFPEHNFGRYKRKNVQKNLI
ncbi:outer mitochondrial membrane transport complex protein domain-containing protein [Ditylenchus destructor]|uniref:Outer mitochondrial membrane transport complex protein domain-containing protein n=1 Tax=Ditylenchus destructor TaxID=166010 RepID=A0AAD4R2F1_9BILA|nr:outer mitochondrial membrane transport complex protein domain-containing protein [Ditylenchus destructor]